MIKGRQIWRRTSDARCQTQVCKTQTHETQHATHETQEDPTDRATLPRRRDKTRHKTRQHATPPRHATQHNTTQHGVFDCGKGLERSSKVSEKTAGKKGTANKRTSERRQPPCRRHARGRPAWLNVSIYLCIYTCYYVLSKLTARALSPPTAVTKSTNNAESWIPKERRAITSSTAIAEPSLAELSCLPHVCFYSVIYRTEYCHQY